jgi:hypothetical protein
MVDDHIILLESASKASLPWRAPSAPWRFVSSAEKDASPFRFSVEKGINFSFFYVPRECEDSLSIKYEGSANERCFPLITQIN